MKKKWINCDVEAEYLQEDRKQEKKQKKMADQTDRSKYKKTDLNKVQKKQVSTEGLLFGRVLSINPQGIVVDLDHHLFVCSLKGSLKQEKRKLKNLVTVGDLVYFEKNSDNEGVISHIAERKSLLSRKDHLHQRNNQLIAANIDQVLITMSVVSPHLKPALIDRYIIAAQIGGMKPVIILNKIDLLKESGNESEAALFDEIVKIYPALGYTVIPISCKTGEGLDSLRSIMKDQISVFSGQSGTGKSSLIMEMASVDLAVGDIIKKTQKGMHTTTTASLLPLPFGGFCIDTPGIRSFGVWDLTKEQVEGYFEEILEAKHGCKYSNCTHIDEPGCAVQKAVEAGLISALRLESYQKLFREPTADF